jgi:hypothetical protein
VAVASNQEINSRFPHYIAAENRFHRFAGSAKGQFSNLRYSGKDSLSVCGSSLFK